MTGGGCGSGCCGGHGGHGGHGGYGGHGGHGAGAGSGGVLVDHGTTTDWHIHPGGCSLIVPGPRLVTHCDPCVSCRCVCACDCCMPCGGCCGGNGSGGHGENGPGFRVDMSYPTYEVIAPAAFLCSNAHCGSASTSCCDPCCCGPC